MSDERPQNNCSNLPPIGSPEWHARNAAEVASRPVAHIPDRNAPWKAPERSASAAAGQEEFELTAHWLAYQGVPRSAAVAIVQAFKNLEHELEVLRIRVDVAEQVAAKSGVPVHLANVERR